MDGVVANLYDYMTERMFQKKFLEINEDQRWVMKVIFRTKMYFDHIFPEGVETVFESLSPFPFNETLIKTVVDFAGEYSILSRPCSLDIEGTKRAKLKWIEKHLSFCPPKEVLLVQDKSSNGRAKDNILIDDWDDFLIRWKEKGGKPIKFRAVDFNDSASISEYIKSNLF